ncbi:hypothetical protein B0T18DRAFT_24762 [Schizothecium vesticola]|uniref:Uncharacterized protein n=1 Tax=Schizothecium vesticola TaxID=314040 RepID=A0AA40KC92_9PEZI|nr:hypothetical protein B0T18DRAFT_24762 [Schizothecium vesticola]
MYIVRRVCTSDILRTLDLKSCTMLSIYFAVDGSVNRRPSTRSIVVPIVPVGLAALQSWAPIERCLRHSTHLLSHHPALHRFARSMMELLEAAVGAWQSFLAPTQDLSSRSLNRPLPRTVSSGNSRKASRSETISRTRDATCYRNNPACSPRIRHTLVGGVFRSTLSSSVIPAMSRKRPPARGAVIWVGARGLSHQSRAVH